MATTISTLPGARAVGESRPSAPAMPLLASFLRAAQRARLRGSTRATFTLARWMRTLQAVPVVINANQTMFVDLRNGLAHMLLEGSPWEGVPWEAKEQNAHAPHRPAGRCRSRYRGQHRSAHRAPRRSGWTGGLRARLRAPAGPALCSAADGGARGERDGASRSV